MNAWSQPPTPYAPPGAWTSHSSYPPAAPPPVAAGPDASTVLYTPGQMVLAAFLGAPIAGSVLLAINEQRLGRPKGVLTALAFGFAMTALLVAVGVVLGDKAPGLPLSLAGIGAVRAFAQMKQADAIAKHLQWGGRKGSGWAAAGIGLLGCVVFLAMIVLGAVGYVLVTGKELE
jgi:hypothetical protein